jgi:hypothetical protein
MTGVTGTSMVGVRTTTGLFSPGQAHKSDVRRVPPKILVTHMGDRVPRTDGRRNPLATSTITVVKY